MSHEDYMAYGDAITFDTTYQTNKYHLSLGLFCSVNHHKTTVIFATGFITKENIDSFVWLFCIFLECMGKVLSSIITDHDLAIKGSLATMFPLAFHRLCKWHIMNKLADKIGQVY